MNVLYAFPKVDTNNMTIVELDTRSEINECEMHTCIKVIFPHRISFSTDGVLTSLVSYIMILPAVHSRIIFRSHIHTCTPTYSSYYHYHILFSFSYSTSSMYAYTSKFVRRRRVFGYYCRPTRRKRRFGCGKVFSCHFSYGCPTLFNSSSRCWCND